jgi:hypothetical protein
MVPNFCRLHSVPGVLSFPKNQNWVQNSQFRIHNINTVFRGYKSALAPPPLPAERERENLNLGSFLRDLLNWAHGDNLQKSYTLPRGPTCHCVG